MADENGGAAPAKKLSPFQFAVIVTVVLGGIYAYTHQEKIFQMFKQKDLSQHHVLPENPPSLPPQPPPANLTPLKTIRIAAWDLTPLDFHKLGDNTRVDRIVETIAGFDIIAIQGITMRNILPVDELIHRLEAKKRHYAYAAYPDSLGRVSEYMVFLYNKDTIRIGQETLREVIDTSLTHRPLMASFCTSLPPPEKAFTFTLVSVKIDEERRETEVRSLGNLYKSIRDLRSAEAEDDIIMLGNFAMPVRMIDSLAMVPNLAAAHSDLPTSADMTLSGENILFDRLKTTEYMEKTEVIDLMKKYNLQIADIYPLTSHLPVCAEFSIFESGKAE
ncbi:MAG: hypothetical protein LBQ54_00125 [Planctomycetaceae bacterium]|jgi:hypothetical protein|nr:hypothetical protein [Planctomycetaceae bacterium]